MKRLNLVLLSLILFSTMTEVAFAQFISGQCESYISVSFEGSVLIDYQQIRMKIYGEGLICQKATPLQSVIAIPRHWHPEVQELLVQGQKINGKRLSATMYFFNNNTKFFLRDLVKYDMAIEYYTFGSKGKFQPFVPNVWGIKVKSHHQAHDFGHHLGLDRGTLTLISGTINNNQVYWCTEKQLIEILGTRPHKNNSGTSYIYPLLLQTVGYPLMFQGITPFSVTSSLGPEWAKAKKAILTPIIFP